MSNRILTGHDAAEGLQSGVEPDVLAPRLRPRGDVPKDRRCLRCDAAFWSEGFGERICRRCKGSAAWRTAVPAVQSTSRRR